MNNLRTNRFAIGGFMTRSLWLAMTVSPLIFVLYSGSLQAQQGGGSKAEEHIADASVKEFAGAATDRAHDSSFVIGDYDVLAVTVWKEPDISRSVPVRSDGKISLPLAGELQAAGLTPLSLEHIVASKLRDYISDPEVTVIVQQINSQRFNILGFVTRPGSYSLAGTATVLDAIAIAGGFRDFAKQKSVYILRHNPDGTESRLPFNYKEVIKGKNSAQNVKL